VIRPGIGVFRGRSGDNRPHRHWAHQISVGLEGDVAFDIDGEKVTARALLIPAGLRHCQQDSIALSIYIDPVGTGPVPIEENVSCWHELPELDTKRLLDYFPPDISLQDALQRLSPIDSSVNSPRLQFVIDTIQTCLKEGREVSRNELAALCHLSPSRFSHWFSEKTGLPLRSYQKWLRLIAALEIAVTTGNLARAATEAGFSDQAHFTRAVSEAFGISPSLMLQLLS